jgi:hypothetical protein
MRSLQFGLESLLDLLIYVFSIMQVRCCKRCHNEAILRENSESLIVFHLERNISLKNLWNRRGRKINFFFKHLLVCDPRSHRDEFLEQV